MKNLTDVVIKNCRYNKDNPDIVIWDVISGTYELPEWFIREFADYVNWKFISKYQELSEEFIREFADRVDWDWISESQDIHNNQSKHNRIIYETLHE